MNLFLIVPLGIAAGLVALLFALLKSVWVYRQPVDNPLSEQGSGGFPADA